MVSQGGHGVMVRFVVSELGAVGGLFGHRFARFDEFRWGMASGGLGVMRHGNAGHGWAR